MSALSDQRHTVLTRDRTCQAAALGLPGPCSGRLQAAHIPGKQETKRRHAQLIARLARGEMLSAPERHLTDTPLERVVSDPRGAVTMCERHHGLLDRRLARLHTVPDHVLEFVAEFALEVELDRLYRTLVRTYA